MIYNFPLTEIAANKPVFVFRCNIGFKILCFAIFCLLYLSRRNKCSVGIDDLDYLQNIFSYKKRICIKMIFLVMYTCLPRPTHGQRYFVNIRLIIQLFFLAA